MAKNILVTRNDLVQIGDILRFQEEEAFEELKLELERAKVIDEYEAPLDLVRINATVTYYNQQDDKMATITIVNPSDSNWTQGRISVLAPLGSALLGLREGQSILWTFPGGTKKLTVMKVHFPLEPKSSPVLQIVA